MNYYNPYFYSIPMSTVANTVPKTGLLTRLFGNSGITIGKFLNGTQRVLNFANQAIPLVKQVRPMIGNAKTMFKVMNEFKRVEKPKIPENNVQKAEEISIEKAQETNIDEIIQNDNVPTFFI